MGINASVFIIIVMVNYLLKITDENLTASASASPSPSPEISEE